MEELLRTKVSCFRIEDSHPLEEIQRYVQNVALDKVLIPIDAMFSEQKKIVLEKKEARLAYNGNDFTVKAGTDSIEWLAQEEVRVYDEEQRFIGMYYYDGEKKCFRIRKMFLSQEERKG